MSIGSYTNVQRVLDYYPAIGSATTISSATVYEYVQAVTDEIDAALSKRFTLPLSAYAPLLGSIGTRMAVADLLTIRAMAQWTEQSMQGNPFFSRLKEARKLLDDIRNGDSQLLNSSGQVITERTDIVGAWSNTMASVQTMHEGDFTDMVQDPNKLQTILDERDL